MSDLEGYEGLQARLTAIGDVDGRFGSRIIRRWQVRTVTLAKQNAPRRTGDLGRSIQPGPIDSDSGTVVAHAAYAGFVEKGTRAYDVVPVRKSVLAWGGPRRLTGSLSAGGSATNFAKRVHIPARAARPFLGPAAQQALGDAGLADEYVIAWNSAA